MPANTAAIKKQLKAKFPHFVFSVTRRNAGYSESINITVKNLTDFVKTREEYKPATKELKSFVESLQLENIDRDERGEILMGGNSYVFLDYLSENGTKCSI